jgi:serine/threonine protein kinase
MVGTRFWRAPKALQALRDGLKPMFTPQVNVYIYMIICYEILIGCTPFQLVNVSQLWRQLQKVMRQVVYLLIKEVACISKVFGVYIGGNVGFLAKQILGILRSQTEIERGFSLVGVLTTFKTLYVEGG